MVEVRFYDRVPGDRLTFVVIAASAGDRWVFCRHEDRDSWELPGGHVEPGETAEAAARRELNEETGALDFSLRPVCLYSVTAPQYFGGAETFGALYYAEIRAFGPLRFEIAEIALPDRVPDVLTYPLIQPHLLAELRRRGLGPGSGAPS